MDYVGAAPDDPVLPQERPDRDWLPPVPVGSRPGLMGAAMPAPDRASKPVPPIRCTA
jgi:hypothetical protein